MAEAKLDFAGGKEMYTKGANSLPRTLQGFAKILGDSEASTALPIFKVPYILLFHKHRKVC